MYWLRRTASAPFGAAAREQSGEYGDRREHRCNRDDPKQGRAAGAGHDRRQAVLSATNGAMRPITHAPDLRTEWFGNAFVLRRDDDRRAGATHRGEQAQHAAGEIGREARRRFFGEDQARPPTTARANATRRFSLPVSAEATRPLVSATPRNFNKSSTSAV